MTDFDQLSDFIARRQSIYPKSYTGEQISDDIIKSILANANEAPSHRKTNPWRFHVFTDDALGRLGDWFQSNYKAQIPAEKFNDLKYKKLKKKTDLSSHVLAITMQRDPKASVPEWEEIAATACAVQNIYLSVTALGLGGYWSSPKIMIDHLADFIDLSDGERPLGFFYIGVPNIDQLPPKPKKEDYSLKTTWHK